MGFGSSAIARGALLAFALIPADGLLDRRYEARAHGGPMPSEPVAGLSGLFGSTHGGYGYFASSEAEADRTLRFGCSEGERRGYFETACHRAPPPGAAAALADEAMRVLLRQRLIDQYFEYYSVQSAALMDARPPLGEPSGGCSHYNSMTGGATARIPATIPADAELAASSLRGTADIGAKYRGAVASVRLQNLVKALALGDQLDEWEPYYCGAPTGSATSPQCIDVQNTRARVRGAYPMLYRPGADLTAFRQATQGLLQAHLAAGAGAGASSSLGSDRWSTAINGRSSTALPDLEDELDRAFQAANSITNPPPAALEDALFALEDAQADLGSGYSTALEAAVGPTGLCSRNLNQLLQENPNVVRQALIEMRPEERAMARMILCESPAVLDQLRPRQDCSGLSSTADSSGRPAIGVARQMFDWPCTSDHYMKITPPAAANADYEVELTVNVVIDPPSLTGANALVQRWGTDAGGWFNCQSGEGGTPGFAIANPGTTIACPPAPENRRDPGVKFNIRMNPVTAASATPPTVTLHRCFNADLPTADQADCTKVRDHAVRRCIEADTSATPAAAKRTACEAAHPLYADNNNRANAANYTTNMPDTVVYHEVAHLMGLADEYADRIYPMNRIGEHDSIMRNSNSSSSRLFPRHLDQIIEPSRCAI